MTEGKSQLDLGRYQSYLYAYPHKTAYRRIEPALPLGPLWAGERRSSLFLYLHVPFCEQRCGFCNLFTQPVPEPPRIEAYLATLDRQVAVVRRALDEGGPFTISRAAIGGGTPTLLSAKQLERLLAAMAHAGYTGAPLSVETSPETALPDRLSVLVAGGADRLSMGIQSFDERECRAVNRPQRTADVHRALRALRDANPAVLNLDLMYGLPGQTETSWAASLSAALAYLPEELYLYPLYVRPLTTLGRKESRAASPDDRRAALYDLGRATLLSAGYRQISMRMFRRTTTVAETPIYTCQDDGMIGLGCGARSYTRGVHYSSEWAVGARSVREIIDRWIAKPDAAFAVADYGFVLDDGEQRRRWLILSLLGGEGLDVAAYRRRFARDPETDFPELAELAARGLVALAFAPGGASAAPRLRLTAGGLAHADAIGPHLSSPAVRRLMADYDLS